MPSAGAGAARPSSAPAVAAGVSASATSWRASTRGGGGRRHAATRREPTLDRPHGAARRCAPPHQAIALDEEEDGGRGRGGGARGAARPGVPLPRGKRRPIIAAEAETRRSRTSRKRSALAVRVAAPAAAPRQSRRPRRSAEPDLTIDEHVRAPSFVAACGASQGCGGVDFGGDAGGECAASGGRAGGFRGSRRDHPCPPRPGRHLVRVGAGAGHQVVARHRPGRRHRPLDVGAVGPRRGGAGPQRHRHRIAQRTSARRCISAS